MNFDLSEPSVPVNKFGIKLSDLSKVDVENFDVSNRLTAVINTLNPDVVISDCSDNIETASNIIKKLIKAPSKVLVVRKGHNDLDVLGCASALDANYILFDPEMCFKTFAEYIEWVKQFNPEKMNVILSAGPVFDKKYKKWNEDLAEFLKAPDFEVVAVDPVFPKYELNMSEILTEYENLFPATSFLVSRFPVVTGDPFKRASLFLTEMPIWYSHPRFYAIANHSIVGDEYGITSDVTAADPEGFEPPVSRALYYPMMMLSEIPGYEYIGSDLDEECKFVMKYKRGTDRVAAIVVTGDTEFRVNATVSGDNALGFVTAIVAEYKGNDVVLSVSEESDVIPPNSIALLTYNVIVVAEAPPEPSGRQNSPALSIPKNISGNFADLAKSTGLK